MWAPYVRVQSEDFDLRAELDALRARDTGVGAVVTFVGTVREQQGADMGPNTDMGADSITALTLEHYPGMTERSILEMMNQAKQRFDIRNARVLHRVGQLRPADQIVMVAVAASHRAEAFLACEFLMDFLKTQAPFWKKAHMPDGHAEWIDACESDDRAMQRWGSAALNTHRV